jgi:formate hydrogenlyase transcriptional activator
MSYSVAAFLLLLLAAATIWALTLGRQIRRRRESEAALQESSQRLGLALQAADMGTWRWDAATNRDTRDAVLNRILGLDSVQSTKELDDAFAHMHPDDREHVREAFDRTIRDHGTYAVEFRVVHPDGQTRWVRSRGRPYYDEHGTLERFTGTVLDITEQRDVEERVALLAHAFRSASDSMSITDPEGKILSVNEAFLRTYGYTDAEVVGQNITIIRSPQIPEGWMAAPSGEWRGEVEQRTKSGAVLRVDVALSVVRDPQGAVVATVGAGRDISHETLAAEALRASEEKFFKVFHASPDSIVITDRASGVIIDVNEAFERITRYSRAEMLGRTLLASGVILDPAFRGPAIARLEAQGSLRDYEMSIRRKNGETATMLLSSELLEIAGRSCILTIARDISERKRFDLHLRQAAEINKLLLSELDPRELHIAIIEAAYQILALDYAGLMLVDPETNVLTLRAQRGVLDSGRSPASGPAVAREAYERGQIRLFRRADLEALGPPAAGLLEAGLQAICSLPLATGRGTLGCLSVGSRRPDAFSSDDLTLLQQLSTHVAIAIQNARAYEEIKVLKDELSEEKLYLEEEIRVSHNFADIVGESAAVRRVLQQIETVAPTDASVLLLGETGTGKELLARALHELSPRKERTFVKVNAAALPATLLESELFGYERGAFTGAVSSKAGRMELAHRGTLFLDEIGDIPLEVQPKLLRALQEREFERLGSTRTQKVDVRVIAATNRDLEQMVDEGTFRSDLFYRLNVFPIRVPPLRERREDIPLLVRYFVQKFASRLKRQITTIPSATMTALQEWDWPGNIRELENVIERAVIVSSGDVLQVPAFSTKPIGSAATETLAEKDAVAPPASGTFEDGERHIILRALRDAKGVIAGPTGAAARLGVKRTTLQSKMRKLGITRPAF